MNMQEISDKIKKYYQLDDIEVVISSFSPDGSINFSCRFSKNSKAFETFYGKVHMTILSSYIATEYLTLKLSDLDKASVKTIKSGDCFRLTGDFYLYLNRDTDITITYFLAKNQLIKMVFTPNSDNVILYQLDAKFSKKIIVNKEQMMMILNYSSVLEPINIETKLDIC